MPDTVGRMTRGVRVISGDRRVVELVPLFSRCWHHHIPVIDGDKQPGTTAQSDQSYVIVATRPPIDRIEQAARRLSWIFTTPRWMSGWLGSVRSGGMNVIAEPV